jgi:two-component system CheB/CheR fusion protein
MSKTNGISPVTAWRPLAAVAEPDELIELSGVTTPHEDEEPPPTATAFPIVGIGASAGGLDAFTQLLRALPATTGMAFVLIQHLGPLHKSFLAEALGKATSMPVSQAQHNERLEPNHVYLIPPDADLSISAGCLTLSSRTEDAHKPHLPIDFFFTALAAERGQHAIGVVLSGTASDGTEGLKAIKAADGITFAQDPETAKFGGMPQSAIEAGVVDQVLTIVRLAEELASLSRHPYLTMASADRGPPSTDGPPGDEQDDDDAVDAVSPDHLLTEIMNLVRAVVGVDFREYKSPTFDRRLARRMALRQIDTRDHYLDLLKRDTDEVRSLGEDALIHVSSFFRDPEVFETLKTRVFPEILRHKAEDAPIRMWVAGCSSGEEVYSLALCLLDFLRDAGPPHPIQIFGSDVSEQSVQKARAGRYADGAMKGISDEQRRRYFTKMEAGYRINKAVRDLCVFVRHDLARDPPFSRVDFLSCRNVLIYFHQSLQRRVLQTFHYSLTQPGFMLLGRTENISGFGQLFTSLDKSSKLFTRSASPSGLQFAARAERFPAQPQGTASPAAEAPRRAGDLGRHLDSLLLARYAPPGVLINEKLEILQFRGQTGAYLQPAPGEPQANLIKMARPGLLPDLRATLARAKKEMAPVETKGVEVDQGGFTRTCDIVVIPVAGVLPDLKQPLFMVLFESVAAADAAVAPAAETAPPPATANTVEAGRIPKLEHQLSATTEYLNSLIEEHSQINDELGSANEELISGNEELQSLNEELETAKEELQSTNEELTTVNDELNHRNQEVGQINSDLVNLLNTVDIPVIILDRQRHIRRFTPRAQKLMNVLPSDIGRLFDDIKPHIEAPDLDQQIADIIDTFVSKESEVRDRGGRWHRMQIRPYKGADDSVDGAIISLVDIDTLKGTVRQAQEGQADAERADRAKDEFLAVLSHELRTPLSVLVMQTHLLRQGGADKLKLAQACDRIERSAKMQVRLVENSSTSPAS